MGSNAYIDANETSQALHLPALKGYIMMIEKTGQRAQVIIVSTPNHIPPF